MKIEISKTLERVTLGQFFVLSPMSNLFFPAPTTELFDNGKPGHNDALRIVIKMILIVVDWNL